jgi:hypothetical protein
MNSQSRIITKKRKDFEKTDDEVPLEPVLKKLHKDKVETAGVPPLSDSTWDIRGEFKDRLKGDLTADEFEKWSKKMKDEVSDEISITDLSRYTLMDVCCLYRHILSSMLNRLPFIWKKYSDVTFGFMNGVIFEDIINNTVSGIAYCLVKT